MHNIFQRFPCFSSPEVLLILFIFNILIEGVNSRQIWYISLVITFLFYYFKIMQGCFFKMRMLCVSSVNKNLFIILCMHCYNSSNDIYNFKWHTTSQQSSPLKMFHFELMTKMLTFEVEWIKLNVTLIFKKTNTCLKIFIFNRIKGFMWRKKISLFKFPEVLCELSSE